MSAERDGSGELEDIELLVEAIYRRYGLDFRHYARASLRRRIRRCVQAEGLASVSGLQEKLLHDPACMERLLLELTVHATAMFRDSAFYEAFRGKVVPVLRTYPFVRLWHAGCSTGEEVYSMAILLEEEGLYDRSRLYATDLSEAVLARARQGVFPLAAMRDYADNYRRAGGRTSFSDYYTAAHDAAILSAGLRRNVVFAEHNLVTDASFNEFQAILCRNVLIYFDRTLQERAHRLFHSSLAMLGVLALGDKESLRFTPPEADYDALDARAKLYRRIA